MAKLTAKHAYVDTGREMPPIHRPDSILIVSKELAELECARLGLKPPVSTLAERPCTYNANGWTRVGNKWMAGQPASNDGMLVRQPLFKARS